MFNFDVSDEMNGLKMMTEQTWTYNTVTATFEAKDWRGEYFIHIETSGNRPLYNPGFLSNANDEYHDLAGFNDIESVCHILNAFSVGYHCGVDSMHDCI
jgi:hypothetical protein